ncbi:hypothetical protein KVR01_003803 [Diaporthe batatas]|uniref:uncharacterized protein n=1 Tax=Diaporthe batatas TaxID=748121 RepID=UPI001D04CD52|nr:uncharacterized protein KVR01_003803 [Diaporthe batatas]KAG8168114.1 hypothetical protein KVR01_003803 [Diaporthe batatas]
MAGPAPSTATVLEFRCLFTHDLRRKQKRWQDGRLKYHTFNARVMVYDDRGNSVGDMHWHGEYDFGEGEEVQLDRGGVIVQVEDLVERKETDLSELVDKRVQEKQQRQMQQLARSRASSAGLPRSLPRPAAVAPDRHQPPRHQALHHVIGTPTGHHGKALVPKESPFEQRQQAAASPDQRTAKRRKYDEPPPSKSGYASALFGQVLTLSATPSNPPPKIRRPRPEAGTGPLPEADAQYCRGEPEPARREQPQSSRRLNHSGYAQSLFGQTLTLSHTPVSSVSLAPQLHNESVSNTTVDCNAGESPQMPRNPAPPRLIARHQLDKFSTKSVPDSLVTQSRACKAGNRQARGKDKGSADIGKSDSYASLSQKHPATKSVQTIPELIDVIEIDDPDPIAPPLTQHPEREQNTQARLQRPGGNPSTSEVGRRETHGPPEDQARSTRQKISEAGHHGKSKKASGNERNNGPDKAVARANGRNASSGPTDTTARGVDSRTADATRDPTLPVTELRIKSSKKRGLLMMSDASKPKKTRREVSADAARSFNGVSTHSPRDSDDDDPFHQSLSTRLPSKFDPNHGVDDLARAYPMVSDRLSSNDDKNGDLEYPLLNRDGEWEKGRVLSELRKEAAVRTISTELGEDEDPFQSQSLAVSEQTYDRTESATRNADQQMGQERLEQAKVTSQNAFRSEMCFVDHGGGAPADILQPTKRSFLLPRVECDPYQIPSSPRASSPGASSCAQRNERDHDHGAGVGVPRSIDNNKNPSTAKIQRQSRRKIIADDGCIDPAASLPSNADLGSDSGFAAVSLVCDEAANKQLQSSKSMKTWAKDPPPTVASGDEGSARPTRKVKGYRKNLGIESEEDGLPLVRHQSRRRRRPQPKSNEPSPLSSEQDGSEEEESPKKRRNTKASKVSEDRPRLEKIKKNVKSRELVGLNLAALNAPLGLRGIGMPFSILPSPMNEPVQTRSPARAVADENRSPVVVESCGDQMLPSCPNFSAAPHKRDAQTSKRDETSYVPLDSSDPDANRSKPLGEDDFSALVEPDAPAYLNVPEIRDFGRPGGRVADSQSPTKCQDKQAVGRAQSLKSSIHPEPVLGKPNPEAQQCHAMMPEDIATVKAAEQTIPSLEKSAQNGSILSRQSSTVANHTILDEVTLETPLKTVANAQQPSVPAQTTTIGHAINTGPLLRDQNNADGQQPSNTDQTARSVTKGQPTESVAADQRANMSTKSQAVTLLNQEKPINQQHSSILEPANASNTVESHPNVKADTFKAQLAVDKPKLALYGHSLTSGDQEPMTCQKIMGNADSDKVSSLPVRSPNSIDLRRQASTPRSINNIGAKLTPQAQKTGSSSTDVHEKPASNARLANPASRGRKAALASHAAGPVPQRMLPPTQPTTMIPVSTADLAATQIEQAPEKPKRQKKKMTFPGFQSARSDGPWSREAFDLLESGKPE